jgi:outer membrane lipoprotein-sorting protein
LELTPTDEEGHKTIMVYEDIAFNVEVPDSMFTFSRLERMYVGTSD